MTTPPPGPWGPPPGDGQYGQPQYGQPQYGQPQYGQPQYGQPQYGQPQYGQPQYGQPQYGQPPYGPPQHGQWDQPQYGPPHGQPQYGEPQPGPPKNNGRTAIVIAVALIVLVAVGVTLFLTLGNDDKKPTARSGSPTPTSGPSSNVASSASAAPDLSTVRSKTTVLYDGMNSAWAQGRAQHNPAPIGAYIAAHNNKAAPYTAAECTTVATEGSEYTKGLVYLPDVSTLRPDPAFTQVTKGKYAGTPVVGTVYALSLRLRTGASTSTPSTVHVAISPDGAASFFVDCG